MLDRGEVDSLQAIVCNAGAQFQGPISYSADGYEETFATNCLGHFLLVKLLIDRITDHGRIVFTASGTHDPDTMDGKMVGAAVVPETGLVRTSPRPVQWLVRRSTMKWVFKRLGVTMDSLDFSGASLAKIVSESFFDGSGKYFQSDNGSLIEARSSKVSYDKGRAARLWENSKLLVELRPSEDPVIFR